MLPFLALILAGCAHGPALVGSADVKVIDAAALPAPTRTDYHGDARPYLLGAYDKVSIKVFGIDELSEDSVQADANGRLSLPLAGTIDAAGHSPAEVAATIADRLRKYVRDPQVSVNLVDPASNLVTVEGEVREPGTYPVIGRMTLMRAVAVAKGTTEFSKLNEVLVFRTVADQRYVALYSLSAIRKGLYRDPDIYANDIVVVGDSMARRVFKDVLQAAPLITTPIIALAANGRL